MTIFDDYLTGALQLPAESLLGSLAFFTVPEGGYDRKQLVDAATDLGLDLALVPHENKPLDAWKKAVKAANEFTYPYGGWTSGGSQTAHILVREVEGGKESALRLLVREVRDSSSRTLDHQVIGEVEFFRPVRHNGQVSQTSARAGSMRWVHRGKAALVLPEERQHLDRLNARYMADYQRHLQFMDAAKVRWMVRDALRSLSGVPVRASTFFVPTSNAGALALWRELMEQRLDCRVVDEDGKVTIKHAVMHRVPLVALQESKQMLVDAVQEDTLTQLNDVMKDIRDLKERRQTVTYAAYTAVHERYQKVMATAMEYTRWLEVEFDSTGAAAEMAQAALKGLKKAIAGGESLLSHHPTVVQWD